MTSQISTERKARKSKLQTFVLIFSLLFLIVVSLPAFAKGNGQSNVRLEQQGWVCITAGPSGWVHCFPPGAFALSLTIPVKVFDSTDLAVRGEYLGIELLIHDSVFQGQPCTQDGGEYDFDNDPYWACHFFDRDH
jgi:hypothetical protein